MKVFIGPVEICGIAQGLSKGFSELGVYSDVVLSEPHSFDYNEVSSVRLYRFWSRLGLLRLNMSHSFLIVKVLSVLMHISISWVVLFFAILKYDAFIFILNKTITNSKIELFLLKLFKKKIIFICVGSDARPPYIAGSRFPSTDFNPDFSKALDLAIACKEKMALHERYANYMVNAASCAQYNQRPFINWYSMGVPKSLPMMSTITERPNVKLRILHCPSNPAAKGSPIILKTIERLKEKGHLIELVKIENMSNEVVLKELSGCDFIVDQLYSDSPMAVFATEAAHFGKPAVVGGYFANEISRYIADADMPPSLYVLPEEFESAVEKLILDKNYRLELGENAKTFVETRWATKDVAERYLRLLNDDVAKEWWCDPNKITYVLGAGMPEEQAKKVVRGMIENKGLESLQLSDKPRLERAFLKMAGLSGDS